MSSATTAQQPPVDVSQYRELLVAYSSVKDGAKAARAML
jgi:hypothetical protein